MSPVPVDLHPAEGKTQREVVKAAGFDVHVSRAGSGDPVLVLHHSTGPLWTKFHDQLAEGSQVVAPDMPGYGESDRPDVARTPSHLALVLHRALDSLDLDRPHLVGLGFGGFVAAEMLAANPGRFRSLTLVGSPGIRPRDSDIHDYMQNGWIEYLKYSFSSEDHFNELFGAEPSKDLLDVWDFSREMTARITWKPWMWSLQLPVFLRGIDTPTLLVWGAEDRVVPIDCAHQYGEVLANSRLEVIDGAGHLVELERPAEVVELVKNFTSTVA